MGLHAEERGFGHGARPGVQEPGIARRRVGTAGLDNCPERHANDWLLQSESDCGRDRCVEDRKRAGHAAQKQRPRQRCAQRQAEAFGLVFHQITAPPAKPKKSRKNETAANITATPKPTNASFRMPPPPSPKMMPMP